MILGNDYDAILNKLFYVADKAPMYNGDDVFKYMKTMEKMTWHSLRVMRCSMQLTQE